MDNNNMNNMDNMNNMNTENLVNPFRDVGDLVNKLISLDLSDSVKKASSSIIGVLEPEVEEETKSETDNQ